MTNYIISHTSDVIKPIIINAENDALLILGSSNQPPLVNTMVMDLLILIMLVKTTKYVIIIW